MQNEEELNIDEQVDEEEVEQIEEEEIVEENQSSSFALPNEATEINKELKSVLAKNFLKKYSILIIIGITILFFCLIMILIVCIIDDDDSSSYDSSGNNCTYSLAGVSGTGITTLENAKVEIVNCDATEDNYFVLETVDFEKYVIGVAVAEIGEYAPDEATKAQIIMARNIALTMKKSRCPSKSNCFWGYNEDTNKIRVPNCERVQVYVDYTRDTYKTPQRSNHTSLYTPEVNDGILWKSKLPESRINELESLAAQVRGKVLLDNNHEPIITSYDNTVSTKATLLASNGYSYEKILKELYNTTSYSNASCRSYTDIKIDYGNYVLSSNGHTILHEPLSEFLLSKGTNIETFNNTISKNVNKNRYGSRAGVVASAVTLIAELGNKYGVKVAYYWGGGHGATIPEGASGNWCSTNVVTTHAFGNNYRWDGLDCSGFVRWALYNGGYRDVGPTQATSFRNLNGAKQVSLNYSKAVLEPGDLLVNGGHVALVVGIDEANKRYITAEAAGFKQGILFNYASFGTHSYVGVSMTNFYNNPSNIRRQV